MTQQTKQPVGRKPLKAQARPKSIAGKSSASARNSSADIQIVNLQLKGRSLQEFRQYLRNAPIGDRINLERKGVSYQYVSALNKAIGISATELQQILKIPSATYKKKMSAKELFAGTSGQAVVGVLDLINKVEEALDPQNPDVRNFNVEKWIGEWIRKPQPSLGGRPPSEFLDTPSGREEVKKVIGAIASGAYL